MMVTQTTISGTMAIFSARPRCLADAPSSPLMISFWISNISKVKIAIRASEAAATVFVALVAVIVVS